MLATPSDIPLHLSRVQFLMKVGECHKLLTELPTLIQQLRELGLFRLAADQSHYLNLALALTGLPLNDLLSRTREFCAEEERRGRGEGPIGASLSYVAMLRGDINFTRILSSEFPGLEGRAHRDKRFLFMLWDGRMDEALAIAREFSPKDEPLQRLAEFVLGVKAPEEDITDR